MLNPKVLRNLKPDELKKMHKVHSDIRDYRLEFATYFNWAHERSDRKEMGFWLRQLALRTRQ